MNATASVVNKIWKYLNVLQKWANMLQIVFCNNLTYKSNYQQVSNFYLMERINSLIWLEITCKWIFDQKLIGFHYRLCSNNGINWNCGLNSNNQTTAASNKIPILEEEGIIAFIHHDMLKHIVLDIKALK